MSVTGRAAGTAASSRPTGARCRGSDRGSATTLRSSSPGCRRARSRPWRRSARTCGCGAAGCSRSRPRLPRTLRSRRRSGSRPSWGSPPAPSPSSPESRRVFRRGVRFPDAATVQPARLVRALRRSAVGAGVVLHERSRVVSIRGGEVATGTARLRAREVVVAANAWMSGWRPASRALTPFGSYVVLTEPVPELLAEIGWTGGEAIADGADVPALLPDDRGRAGADGLELRADRPQRPDRRALLRRRGRLSRGPSRGSAGCCPDSRPRGWSGRGAGRSTSRATSCPSSRPCPARGSTTAPATRGTASARAGWAGRSSPRSCWARTTSGRACRSRAGRPPRLPPEPVRHLGGALVRRAILSVEAADEAGRRPAAPRARRRCAPARPRPSDRDAVMPADALALALGRGGAARALERPPRPHTRPAGSDGGGLLHGGGDLRAGGSGTVARRGRRLEVRRRQRRVRARLRAAAEHGLCARSALGLLSDRPRAGTGARADRRGRRAGRCDFVESGGGRVRGRRRDPARPRPPARPCRDRFRPRRSPRRSPATR